MNNGQQEVFNHRNPAETVYDAEEPTKTDEDSSACSSAHVGRASGREEAMTLRRHTTIGLDATVVMLEAFRGVPMPGVTRKTVRIEKENHYGKAKVGNGQEVFKAGKLPRPPQGNHKSRRLGG